MNRIDRSYRAFSQTDSIFDTELPASQDKNGQSSADIFAEIELSLDNFRERAQQLRKAREEQFAASTKAMQDLSGMTFDGNSISDENIIPGNDEKSQKDTCISTTTALKEPEIKADAVSSAEEEAGPEIIASVQKAEEGEETEIEAEPEIKAVDGLTEAAQGTSEDNIPLMRTENIEIEAEKETSDSEFTLPKASESSFSAPVPDSIARIMDILTNKNPLQGRTEKSERQKTDNIFEKKEENSFEARKPGAAEINAENNADTADDNEISIDISDKMIDSRIFSLLTEIRTEQTLLSSEVKDLSTKIDSARVDVSEKIHKEGLSSYRNIQELFKEEAAARKNSQEDLKKLQKVPALAKAGLVLAAINTGIIALLVMSI